MTTTAPHTTHGVIDMRFVRPADSPTTSLEHLYRQAPSIVQRALYFDPQLPTMACVYLLSSGGPVLDGDRYTHRITLLEGAQAHISTGAATKLAPMPECGATLQSHVVLHPSSHLEWLPEPTIACRDARYLARTTIDLADPSATLFWSECYSAGRIFHGGERWNFERLDSLLRLRIGGHTVYVGHEVVEPRAMVGCGEFLLADYDYWASILICAPVAATLGLYGAVLAQPPSHDHDSVALAVGRLDGDVGLAIRLCGRSLGAVQRHSRRLCGLLRERLFGCSLQADFPWR